jgi:SAM-dependent methyltransferase
VEGALDRHRGDWELLAENDPFWAALTVADRRGRAWTAEDFLATGEEEIAGVLGDAERLGLATKAGCALDFGCGAGRLTRALGRRFEEAVGVDISEAMVTLARKLNDDVPSCRFEVNARPDLSLFADGTFDFAYSALVLQHMPSREVSLGYIAELLRVARGGVLVFGVPDEIALPYRLGLSRRAFLLLRRLGVSGDTLLRRTPLTPMRMTVVPERDVRAAVEAAGASIRDVDRRREGGVVMARYFVSGAANVLTEP